MGPRRVLPFARAALRRRGARPVWKAGALLLVPAVVKLFVLDLARSVAFIGVGVMMLANGTPASRVAAATDTRSLNDATTRRQ